VTDEKCETVNEEQCDTVSEEVCETINEEKCETVQVIFHFISFLKKVRILCISII
jgi:hypothetical protein